MYRKFALVVILTLSHVGCFALENESFSRIKFLCKEMPFGMQQQSMTLVDEHGITETIGSIAIVSNKQLCMFDTPMFKGMNKRMLPSEVVELLDIIPNIKSELKASLESVVILGDLYIDPKFRGHGYAGLLIQNTCEEIFATTKSSFIVVIPAPFEYENNLQKSLRGTPEYEAKKERLVKLYQRNGFIPSQTDPFFMYLEKNR